MVFTITFVFVRRSILAFSSPPREQQNSSYTTRFSCSEITATYPKRTSHHPSASAANVATPSQEYWFVFFFYNSGGFRGLSGVYNDIPRKRLVNFNKLRNKLISRLCSFHFFLLLSTCNFFFPDSVRVSCRTRCGPRWAPWPPVSIRKEKSPKPSLRRKCEYL